MKFLTFARTCNEKTVFLLRNLSKNSEAILATNPKRSESSLSNSQVDKDAPVDIKNPFEGEKRVCILCKHNVEPDYKNVRLLSQFQSRFTGKIYGRHITGLCKAKHEKLVIEVAKAQNAGMMGIYTKEMLYVNDPKIFDIDKPFRPHKY